MTLVVIILALYLLGIVFVYESSLLESLSFAGNKFHFAKLQTIWVVISFIVMCIVTYLPLVRLKKIALPSTLFTLFLLVIVLIPGIGHKVGGARRWLPIGPYSFQPSELAKISYIIYFAHLFEKKITLQSFTAALGLGAFLILLQPDLDTTILITVMSVSMFYLGGAALFDLLKLAVLGFLGLVMLIATSPYRLGRFLTLLNVDRDPTGESYHIKQALLSLGSGGLFGVGFGKSLQRFRFLPEATTDSIFAVYAEETGFIGGVFLLMLFTVFALRGLHIAKQQEDPFTRLIAYGVVLMIILQVFINIASMVALIPLSGITLPFISYGGSSLLITSIGVGLLLNVSRNHE